MPKTDDPVPIETEFSDEELQAMLGVVADMTPGNYIVPPTNPARAPHHVKVCIHAESQAKQYADAAEFREGGLMCLAAVLGWGPDILDEMLHIEDHGQRTRTKQRVANATAIAWAGNNLQRLLYETLEMRKLLQAYGLLEPRR